LGSVKTRGFRLALVKEWNWPKLWLSGFSAFIRHLFALFYAGWTDLGPLALGPLLTTLISSAVVIRELANFCGMGLRKKKSNLPFWARIWRVLWPHPKFTKPGKKGQGGPSALGPPGNGKAIEPQKLHPSRFF